jgi:hypothetical protein
MRPEIKILAISNVYSRLMHFHKTGDQEDTHLHHYDHGTLLASGRLLVEKLDVNNNITYSKEFVAPSFILVEKNAYHRLTALEDNTVASCIHALRDSEENIVDPEFIVGETVFADNPDQRTDTVKPIGEYFKERGKQYKTLVNNKK